MSDREEIVISMIRVVTKKECPKRENLQSRETLSTSTRKSRSRQEKVNEDDTGA